MKMSKVYLVVALVVCFNGLSQQRVAVTETTLALGFDQTAEVFYSFAAGDEIVFNMNMIQGKHIKAVEIVELPNNVVFSAFKASVIRGKRIKVRNKGLYAFRFYSSSLTNRVCRYRIDRIPSSPSTKNFNTNWKWLTVRDTIYTPYQQDSLTGYAITDVKKKKKVLIKTDTIISEVFSRTERVHSKTALEKPSYSYINVYLPKNKYHPDFQNQYNTVETIAWSHWLGVGKESLKSFEEANKNMKSGIGILGQLTGYGALAQLAISGVSIFRTPIGDNVNYKFVGVFNGSERVFHNGNGTVDARKHEDFTQGSFSIELYNDNLYKGIDVAIKIIAIQINKIWKDKEYFEQIKTPQYTTLNKTRIHVNETKIRVPVE